MWMYVGTYTNKGSKGIYGLELDESTGKMSEPKLIVETPNPSFLAHSTKGDRLYAACDPGQFGGKRGGGVAAFAVDGKTRGLTPLNNQPSGKGGNCFVAVHPENRYALTADYGDALVDLLPINADGTLQPSAAKVHHEGSGPNKGRQEKAHAHSFYAAPIGPFALSCDLGTDEVIIYRVNDQPLGLTRHGAFKVAPGSGPRHLTFSNDRRFVYVINELDNTIDVLKWDADAGTLSPFQRVQTLPAEFHGTSSAAEICQHPSGAFVYASNRGHDSIAVFHVDRDTGMLSPAGHTPVGGKQPRHFSVDPSGRFLVAASQQSDNITAFRIDAEHGTLTATGGEVTLSQPVCVVFQPT
ncbi:MAG: pgl 2 [Phycisphaerales bacterium]|nr:pgl 2 [Phycisphaerales bacterium]